jgi:hypothetical protein
MLYFDVRAADVRKSVMKYGCLVLLIRSDDTMHDFNWMFNVYCRNFIEILLTEIILRRDFHAK